MQHLRQQHVAFVTHRTNELRLRALIELTAQAADLTGDRPVEGLRIPPTGQIDELIPTQHPLRMLHKGPQQHELPVGEIDKRPAGIP